MATAAFDVVIVGAGQAGGQCAILLRDGGFKGSIALIGEEPELPYERPPLSKAYFVGGQAFEKLMLRPAVYWRDNAVTMMLGERVVRVDPPSQCVETASGQRIGYTTLVWAAGCAPRRLSCEGADLQGVHVLRTRDDVDAIRRGLSGATRVAIVGGGYIGLELASALNKLKCDAAIFEAAPRLLSRTTGEVVSQFFRDEHERHGVRICVNASVRAIEGRVTAEGKNVVAGIRLADGTHAPADLVVVGIGVVPAVKPLKEAGVMGEDGVDVNEYCRTNIANIFAIGDCAAHRNAFAFGRRIRLESYQNAMDMAKCAASSIMGVGTAYSATPWFWSDQYDLHLQSIGISAGHDQVVVRGDVCDRAFTVAYARNGKLIALDCINSPRDYVQGRNLVMSGAIIDFEKIRDKSVPLRAAVIG